MSSPWYNLQRLIIDFLTGNIEIYEDDGLTAITGVISGAWYDKAIFGANGYQITVSPLNVVNARIADIGMYNKFYDAIIYVDVWVLQKRGVDYTPERIRDEILHEIDEVFWQVEAGRSLPDISMNAGGWQPLDEPENKILRSRLTVGLWLQKHRSEEEVIT